MLPKIIYNIFNKYPILRGMAAYAILWPTSSVVQEYLVHGKTPLEADWTRAGRYSFFGAMIIAPLFHRWLNFTNKYFQARTLLSACRRGLFDQFTFSPMTLTIFFFGMSLLEGNSIDNSIDEVKRKFWPTYKINFLYWQVTQALNFYFVSPQYRVVVVSCISFIWTIFLAHIQSSHCKQESTTAQK